MIKIVATGGFAWPRSVASVCIDIRAAYNWARTDASELVDA